MSRISDWFASWKLVSWRTAIVIALVLYTLVGFWVVPWITERIIINTAQERLGREVRFELRIEGDRVKVVARKIKKE